MARRYELLLDGILTAVVDEVDYRRELEDKDALNRRLMEQLAEVYRLSGGAGEGPDWSLAAGAVKEVDRLRHDYDEVVSKCQQVKRDFDVLRDKLLKLDAEYNLVIGNLYQ